MHQGSLPLATTAVAGLLRRRIRGSLPVLFSFNRDFTSLSTSWSSSGGFSSAARIARVVFFQFFLRPESILSSSSSLIFQAPSESLSLPGCTMFSDFARGFPLRSIFLANLLARSSEGYLWGLLLLNYFLGRIIGWQSIASRFICSLAVDCQPIVDPESIIESLHHNSTGITRNPDG